MQYDARTKTLVSVVEYEIPYGCLAANGSARMAIEKIKRALVYVSFDVAMMVFIVALVLFTWFMLYKHYGVF